MFDYIGSFESAVTALNRERRYRVFVDPERCSFSFSPFSFALNVDIGSAGYFAQIEIEGGFSPWCVRDEGRISSSASFSKQPLTTNQ